MDIREKTLPVLAPKADEDDIKAVTDTLRSGWWINGPKVKEFESQFAKMVGKKHAIAVTSNTHALDLVLKAHEINGKDSEVLSPTMSFATTVAVPLWNNCTNVLCDVDPINMNISVEDVKKKVTEKTKAIICVNLAGILAPIEDIRKFYSGLIIEDCAHACYSPGAGSKGDIAVWSFQAVKTMPTGDGGMITTDNDVIAEKIRKLTWFGIQSTYDRVNNTGTGTETTTYKWEYDIDVLGYKYYMIDLTAALGLSQLSKLNETMMRRQFIQKCYNDAFSQISKQIQIPPFSYSVQHYVIKVDPKRRNKLIDYLKEKNIHTSVHYRPLHLFTQFRDESEFPVADEEWKKMLSLPVHMNMTDDDIKYVIFWVKEFFFPLFIF